jgi:hypothetical protein
VPNDSAGLSARAMMRRVSMGLRKGAADLVLVLPGNVIFLEVKKPDGTQSTDQKRFQGKIEELGHRYEIVRSLEEFKALADCLGYAAK